MAEASSQVENAGVTVDPDSDSPWRWGLLACAALVVLGVGIKAAHGIVAPVFLAVNLVIVAYPIQYWLRRCRWPGWLAGIASLMVVYAMLLAILGAAAYSVAQLAATIPDYSRQFQNLYDDSIERLTRLGIGEDQLREIFSNLDVNNFTGIARTLLDTLSSTVSLLILVATLIIFVAMDATSTTRRLDWIAHLRPSVARGLRDFGRSVRTYWVVSTIFGLVVAIMDGVALAIIGVPLATTWAILAFVTNYIPNVGFILGLVPPALFALLDEGVGTMIVVIIVYSVINFTVQVLIQPKLVGDAVGINATLAFISLIFWSYLLGPLGTLLAIPATLFVKSILVDHTPGARWVSAMIASSDSLGPLPDAVSSAESPPPERSFRHQSPY